MDLEFKPGDIVLGKLRVERLLGAGGLGAVYEVHHTLTHHRRALKLLHPRFRDDTNVITRFIREASAAGRIGNPHIVDAFDAGTLESGAPYLLMEMLEGEPLAERLRRAGRLSVGETALLMRQTCDAIGAAHDAGIVHRDLKPDNLFVTQRDGRPFIKVLDFGISKFDVVITGAQQVTQDNTAMGTPLYMAPEQMRGAKEVDARADVYSIGIILYECLAGGTPYAGDSFAELAAKVLAGNPRRLDTLREDLTPELVNLVHSCMALRPEDRPSTAAEVARQLSSYAESGVFVMPAAERPSFRDTLATPVGMTGQDSGLDKTSAPGAAARTNSNDTRIPATRPATAPPEAAPAVVQTPSAPKGRFKRVVLGVVLALALPKLAHTLLASFDGGRGRKTTPVLQSFTELEVEGGRTVVVKKGLPEQNQAVENLSVGVLGATLKGGPQAGAVTLYTERLEHLTVRNGSRVTVELGAAGPCRLDVRGGSTVHVDGLDCASAELDQYGSTVTLAGAARELVVELHDGAVANLKALRAKHLTLNAHDSTANATVQDRIDGQLHTSQLTYEGAANATALVIDKQSKVDGPPPPALLVVVDAGAPEVSTRARCNQAAKSHDACPGQQKPGGIGRRRI